MNHAQLAFNGGELSPYGRHRVDFEKHPTGAEEMTNFLPHPFGSMVKRPGLAHIGTFTHDTDEGKAFPFKSSDGTKYIICVDEDNGITIVKEDGTVADTVDYLADANISDNYTLGTDNMRELQLLPVNDVAFLVHQKIQPCRLTRNSDTDWTVEPIPFSYVPLANINSSDTSRLRVGYTGTVARGAWATSTAYLVGDHVTYGGDTYVCRYGHTSTTPDYPVEGDVLFVDDSYSGTPPDGYYEDTSSGSTILRPIWTLLSSLGEVYLGNGVAGGTIYGFVPGQALEVYSSAGIFTSDMVGSKFFYAKTRINLETQDKVSFAATGKTTSLYIQKKWSVTTTGTWTGSLYLEYSDDGNQWIQLRQWSGSGDRNISESGEFDSPKLLRLSYTKTGTTSGGAHGYLNCDDSEYSGFFEIDGYTDANNVTATALDYLPWTDDDEIASSIFAEEAFNTNQGFPKAVCLHEGRLIFASTDLQPNSIWLSQSDDYLNFETGVNDNDGIAKTLQAPFSDPIRWLASQRRLFIGTSKAEYVSGSETSDQPLTPTNFVARKYTNAGSNYLPPLVYDDGVIFAGRGGGRIHEIGFEIERSSYAAQDLSRLAEHITAAGIQSMDFQQTREPIVWMVRTDGTLLALSYNRKERLSAWSKHTTQDGTFEDVVVFPGDDGDDDVFFLIKRGSSTCLERFPSGWQSEIEDNSGWLAVDGVQGSGTSITIPTHLLNEDIDQLLNGDSSPVESDQNYSSSPQAIASADWQIGFPIVAQYQSLPLDSQAEDGSTLSRKKRIHKASLSLYQSRGGKTWNKTSTDKQDIPNTDTSVVLRTQWEDTIVDPGNLDDVQLRIYHADPFPFTVRAAAVRWNLLERH